MDMMGSLDKLIIDYQRCELEARPSNARKPFTIQR
jgi:hypothetical protein